MSAKILALLEHPEPLRLVAESLEHFGHAVSRAKTFAAAMDILRHTNVEMIIADVHLQNGGSIFDFMRWVKGDPHTREIPFVCLSTEPVEVPKYLSEGVRTAARAMGAARYITMEKFDAELFRREIEWLLPQHSGGSYYADPAAKEPINTEGKNDEQGNGKKGNGKKGNGKKTKDKEIL